MKTPLEAGKEDDVVGWLVLVLVGCLLFLLGCQCFIGR